MEPRSFKRGNQPPLIETTAAQVLQWSHVHSNVETINNKSIMRSLGTLQWSHVHSNVETREAVYGKPPADEYCFNGATFIQTWKHWSRMSGE